MELAMLHGIQTSMGCAFLNTVMPFITLLGEQGFIWIALGICLLISKRYRAYGIMMLAGMLAVYLVGTIGIKMLVARPRPFVTDPSFTLLIDPPSGYSFPSGHSSAAFAAASVFCFMPVRKRWKVCVVVLACLIAFSRLYLCVHYPSDVLVGAAMGIAFGILAVYVGRRVLRRRAQAAE